MSATTCSVIECDEYEFVEALAVFLMAISIVYFWIHYQSILFVRNALAVCKRIEQTSSMSGGDSDKFSFLWTIEDFSRYCEEEAEPNGNLVLFSPSFGPFPDDPLQFRLDLRPRDVEDEGNDFVSLYLNLVSCEKDQVTVLYSLSIVDKKGNKGHTLGNRSPDKGKFFPGDTQGFRSFIERDVLLDEDKGWLVDGKLTIYCEVVLVDSWTYAGQSKESHLRHGVMDFGSVYGDENLSDVMLVAGGKEFAVYKGVLATRSPVLAALFEQSNRAELFGVKRDVARELLKFIYTGKCPSLDKLAIQLLTLACELQIESLRTECEKSLCAQLSAKNVLALLRLAQTLGAKQLKDQALAYYAKHTLNTIGSTKDPQLLMQTFRRVVLQKE